MSTHAAIHTHAPTSGIRRPASGLIQWVLLWFALSLGSAIASPMVHPQTLELVCSAAGLVKVIVHTDDGVQELGASHMDCPLCVQVGTPPSTAAFELPTLMPVADGVRTIAATHIAAAAAAPMPARGPPPPSLF
ncbi:hypothetical protein [Acidovorax sp. Leaf78]|uniref:DUF2946 family protein n=1 Tax=unclassified Acidovorax TaxID=2684926 RepID=UPI0006F994DB|nr:hypothetical protein [Acidovorax sp. Leaf78]KQO23557.1 hypothetical protein ASF16_05225 [Acidovorax sp. Leaf78]